MRMLALAILAILAARDLGAVDPPSGNSFALRDVRVFDGEHTIPSANVIILDGRIGAIGASVEIPSDLPVVDGHGKTLIPGLIDSHVHVFKGAQADALRFGVTTEMDMFNVTHEFSNWRAQRQSLDRTREADTWSAGTGASAPGGHPDGEMPDLRIPTLSRATDAESFVKARIAEGSDYIKLIMEDHSFFTPQHLIPTLSPEEVCAVIKAAHEAGKMALVHITVLRDARIAVQCGVDGLAHLFPDRLADSGFVKLARERHIFVITTLSVVAAGSGWSQPRDVYARADVKSLLSAAQEGTLNFGFQAIRPHGIATALQSLRILHAAGIPILAGTDAPNPGAPHGVGLHVELQLLVSGGFSPSEALAAATSVPAQIFHLSDRGRIVPGFRADLVLVDGDPTQNINSTLSIDRIWKNGFAVDRRATH
jgi:imidazolonepropionase-like amidohydrolase